MAYLTRPDATNEHRQGAYRMLKYVSRIHSAMGVDPDSCLYHLTDHVLATPFY